MQHLPRRHFDENAAVQIVNADSAVFVAFEFVAGVLAGDTAAFVDAGSVSVAEGIVSVVEEIVSIAVDFVEEDEKTVTGLE